MGKYFKDQELTSTKKRFKQSAAPNKNIREAGIIDVAPKMFQGLKNAFSFLMKMNKSVKFDPTIVTKLESEFLSEAATFNQAIAKHKAAADLAQQELNDITNGVGKYANMPQAQITTAKIKYSNDLANANSDLQAATDAAESKLGSVIKDFNDSRKFPIKLELGKDASGKITLSHGILSKGAGDAIDYEGLKKALNYLRPINPASEGGLERLLTLFRGIKGNAIDSASFLRNLSKDTTISGILNQKYTWQKTVNRRTIEETKTLLEIMEEVAKNGEFVPPKGTLLGGVDPAGDFDRLVNTVTAAQSGVRNPMVVSALSAMGTAIKVGITAPFLLPMGQKAIENVSKFWGVDERIRSQERVNREQSQQPSQSPEAQQEQLKKEQENNLLQEIQYAQDQQRIAPNENFKNFWITEEQRARYELQNLGK